MREEQEVQFLTPCSLLLSPRCYATSSIDSPLRSMFSEIA